MKLWKQVSLMPKGHKRVKGVPELHDELKTRVNLSLTPTAVEGLDAIASELKISRSELVERIGRGEIQLEKQRILNSVNPIARKLLEKATQNLRKPERAKTMVPSLNVIQFKDCDRLPNAPGAYIVTDLIAEYYGSSLDLQSIFLDNEFIRLLAKNFSSSLKEDCFVLWMVCKKYDALPYIRKQLQLFFSDLQHELWLNQLAINLSEQSTSESHGVNLAPELTLLAPDSIMNRIHLERNLEEDKD